MSLEKIVDDHAMSSAKMTAAEKQAAMQWFKEEFSQYKKESTDYGDAALYAQCMPYYSGKTDERPAKLASWIDGVAWCYVQANGDKREFLRLVKAEVKLTTSGIKECRVCKFWVDRL